MPANGTGDARASAEREPTRRVRGQTVVRHGVGRDFVHKQPATGV